MKFKSPVYLYHIRKTGGRSLIFSLLSQFGNAENLYQEMARASENSLLVEGTRFVGWRVERINQGLFDFAFSHEIYEKIRLPQNTFTITSFRDPFKRLLSHYKMLLSFQLNEIDHPCMQTEGKWLGNDFSDFLKKIPREHALRQLYVFSSAYSVSEAIERIEQLSFVYDLSSFECALKKLELLLNFKLPIYQIRNSSHKEFIVPDKQIGAIESNEEYQEQARELLAPEYELMRNLQTKKILISDPKDYVLN